MVTITNLTSIMSGLLRDHNYALRLPEGLPSMRRYSYNGIFNCKNSPFVFDCSNPIGKAYKCNFCSFMTTIRLIYINHLNKNHSVKGIFGYGHIILNSKYQCDQCDVSSFSQLILLKHVCTREVIKYRTVFYVCYLCHFTVGGKLRFSSPKKNKFRFECDQCEFTAHSADILFLHTSVYHPSCSAIIVKHILEKHKDVINKDDIFFKCEHLSTTAAGDLNIKFWKFAKQVSNSRAVYPIPSSDPLSIKRRMVYSPFWK